MMLITPTDVAYRNGDFGLISGWVLDEKTIHWHRVRKSLVDPVWVDFMYLKDLKKYAKSYNRILYFVKQHEHPCVNYPFSSKEQIYHLLANGGNSRPACLPDTSFVESVADIKTALRHQTVIWLKPIRGSGGRNIVRIEKRGHGRYHLFSPRLNTKNLNRSVASGQFHRFLRQTLRKRQYLLQEELALPEMPDGRKIDVRVTVSRDSVGDWVVTATTLRIGKQGQWVTNHHAGGQFLSVQSKRAPSVLRLAKLNVHDMRRCEVAAVRVARILQKHTENLGFLGIDVAPIDECCYVYDCNTKPGRDILTNSEIWLMMKRLSAFLDYLVRQRYGRP